MESHGGIDGPLVSVIMPCRNGLPFLKEALASLQAQTYRNWELIFVDGGSTDGSARTAFAAIPEALILQAPDAPPPGAARNQGFGKARGALLAFLDADDRWSPEKLERQVRFLLESRAGLVYSDCRVVDADGRVLGRYLSRHEPARGEVFEALLNGNFIPLPTILVTRKLFARSGGFGSYLRSAGDYDWLLRASRHGSFDFLPEPLADYRVTATSLTGDFRASYRENVELLQDLQAVEESPEARPHIEAAVSMVLWRWAIREVLAGPAAWKDAVGLARRAMGAGPKPSDGLRALLRVLRDGLRGFWVRLRILRARRPRP